MASPTYIKGFNAGYEKASRDKKCILPDLPKSGELDIAGNRTVYYFLENYDLEEVELESDVVRDGQREITFKILGTDEGGR